MKTKSTWLRMLALGSLVATLPMHAASRDDAGKARASVTFESPEKFADIRDADNETERGRRSNLDQLEKHIQARAAAQLPAGYALVVKVTDVDLAGEYEPSTRPARVRIVKDLYPPKIDLEYTLTDAAGRTVSSGKRELRDPGFLQTTVRPRSNDILPYENALIDDWMRNDFGKLDKSG